MKEHQHKRQRTTGLPPGTLLEKEHTAASASQVTIYAYNDRDLIENSSVSVSALSKQTVEQKERDTVQWIDIVGIEDSELLREIGNTFAIHSLTLEDIQNTDQRPKIEDHGNYLYVVCKMLWLDPGSMEIRPEQVSLLLLDNTVISFQESEGDTFGIIRDRIRGHKGRIRSSGADYLLYAILDSIVDYYFHITETIEELFDETEKTILLGKEENISGKLYTFSTQLTELRRCFQPLREVIFQMQKRELTFIDQQNRVFISDIQDHIFIIADTHDTLREKLSNLQNMHSVNLSNRMNSVMKVLTIIATIFIPLTFIVGVYGMNFVHMPELQLPWAYPLVLGVMCVIVIVMLILFKRRKWL